MADLGEEAFSSQMKVVTTFLRLLEELMRNKQLDLRYGTKTQRRGILRRMKDFVGGIFKKVYDGTFGRLSRNGKDYGQLDLPMLYAIGLAITVLIVWLYTFMYAGNYRYGEEAGSAKWGTLKEGVAFKDQSDPSNNLLFTKNYGLALKKPKFDLEHDRNLNVMVIGGSGSGKTRNYVKPNLMQLNASYFLTDPKGTSLPECGYLFRDNGYRIKVFNTIEFNKSMHYNPLKYVKTDADILSFVNCLISNTNGDKQSGGDPFWENSERLLYTALIALLRDWFPPEDYSLDGLLTLLSMAEAKENDENFKSPLDMIFDEIETGKVYERNPFYQGPSTSSSYADAESDRMAISENTTDEFTWQSKHGWQFIFDFIDAPIDLSYVRQVHQLVSNNLVPDSGQLRYFDVYIGGTSWQPEIPDFDTAKAAIEKIANMEPGRECALKMFGYLCRSQLFSDGNKRTAQLIANKMLIADGCGILAIPKEQINNFETLLLDFYETNKPDKFFSFLTKEAIYGLDRTVPSSQNLKVKCKAATLGSNALKTRSNTVGISKTQNADRTAHTEHIE